MNKINVSMRELKKGYQFIIKTGYCDLWYLMQGQEPRYYTSGVYGWNCDAYHINNNLLITTGYRPFGNIDTDYIINKEYNEKAREIWNGTEKVETKKEKINILLNEYIKKVLEG